MQVIPAIDLMDGRCVRLTRGDFSDATVYSDDPAAVARRWASMGAGRIHVVDLDGARTGAPVNAGAVRAIVDAAGLPVQLGGGIRSAGAARSAVAAGADRVMVGTAAAAGGDELSRILDAVGPEGLIVSVDARDGMVAVEGWTEPGGVSAEDLAGRVRELGAARIMYTDVTRDGTLTEPNFGEVRRLVDRSGLAVIAAGGIASADHVARLAGTGAEGVVVGRALYTGDIDLAEAIAAAGPAAGSA